MKWIGGIAWVALSVACSNQPPETIVQVIESADGQVAELRGELEKERQANVAARAKLEDDFRRLVREEVRTALAAIERERVEAAEVESRRASEKSAELAARTELQAARNNLVMAERKYTQESDQIRVLRAHCERLQARYDALREHGAK
ncbi:MAG: hypothetical protein ACYS0E_08755 [Planctomycetota bacterium]|jgi:hypothetical protein